MCCLDNKQSRIPCCTIKILPVLSVENPIIQTGKLKDYCDYC